jgi:hypothetical protein
VDCGPRCSRPTWSARDDLGAELPLHADHALARAGLHRDVDRFARLEQRGDAGDAAILVERSADLNVGELQRTGTRDRRDDRQHASSRANDDSHYFFSSAMRASRPFIAVAASALQP